MSDELDGGIDLQAYEPAAHAPERIFATVNGSVTRVPDGFQQLTGGWDESPRSTRAVEYVRADIAEAALTAAGVKPRVTDAETALAEARKIISDNWCGQWWRAVSHDEAEEVNQWLSALTTEGE